MEMHRYVSEIKLLKSKASKLLKMYDRMPGIDIGGGASNCLIDICKHIAARQLALHGKTTPFKCVGRILLGDGSITEIDGDKFKIEMMTIAGLPKA